MIGLVAPSWFGQIHCLAPRTRPAIIVDMFAKLAAALMTGIVLTVAVPWSGEMGVSSGVEKGGCCSKHKGVCGCQDGRVVCCDKTLSPTCTCP